MRGITFRGVFGPFDSEEVLCDKCGKALVVGDFPFCPHGRTVIMIERDEIPGGVIVENYGPKPIRFDSHSERRAYMKAHGLQEREKFSPLPGTGRDPQGIPNPVGYMDPQTMENARILLSRAGALKEYFDAEVSGVLNDFESGTIDHDSDEGKRRIADARKL